MDEKNKSIINHNSSNIIQLENGAKLIGERYNNNYTDRINHQKGALLNKILRNNNKKMRLNQITR